MKRLFGTSLTLLLLLLSACRSAGSSETQTINLPYPTDTAPVTLNLDTTAGQVTVSAGDSAGVAGTLTTNVGAWWATTSTSGSTLTIRQGRASADVIPNAQNTWDLQVGAGTPLILNHTNTAANTTLNLGGLAVTQVNATATSGSYTLRFPTPTTADGATASFQLTNGKFDAAGLLNSGLTSLTVTTTGGDVHLGFDGAALAANMSVSVNTQAGNVQLNIPPNVPAQVTYRTSSGRVLELDPAYTKINNITYTVGGDTDGARLSIDIRTVVGDLRLAGA